MRPDIVLPDAYEYIKTGEKEYPYALAVDEIPAATYTKWQRDDDSYIKAIASSQQRINSNEQMQKNREYARWLQQQEEDREIPLNYAAFKAWQDETDATAEKYKNLNRSADSLVVWSLAAQQELFVQDTVTRADYQRWFKGLSRDLQLQEAVLVVGDLDGVSQ